MIRIEGIPIVAARLEAAQKAKTMKARRGTRRAAKSAIGGKVQQPIGALYRTSKKCA